MPLYADELRLFEERELGKHLQRRGILAKYRLFMLVKLKLGRVFCVIDLQGMTEDDRLVLELIRKKPEWMAKHIAEAQGTLRTLIGKRTPYIRPP